MKLFLVTLLVLNWIIATSTSTTPALRVWTYFISTYFWTELVNWVCDHRWAVKMYSSSLSVMTGGWKQPAHDIMYYKEPYPALQYISNLYLETWVLTFKTKTRDKMHTSFIFRTQMHSPQFQITPQVGYLLAAQWVHRQVSLGYCTVQ